MHTRRRAVRQQQRDSEKRIQPHNKPSPSCEWECAADWIIQEKGKENLKENNRPGMGSDKKSGVPSERVTGVKRRKRAKQCNFCPPGTRVSVWAGGIVSPVVFPGRKQFKACLVSHTHTHTASYRPHTNVLPWQKKPWILPSNPTPNKQTTQKIPWPSWFHYVFLLWCN